MSLSTFIEKIYDYQSDIHKTLKELDFVYKSWKEEFLEKEL